MITYAGITVFSKNPEGYGVGVELSRRNGDQYVPYTIMSLWVPKEDYPSKWQLFPHIFSEIFKYVKDQEVILACTSNYFGSTSGKFRNKAGIYAEGKKFSIKRLRHTPGSSLFLAIDSVNRKTNIIEEL